MPLYPWNATNQGACPHSLLFYYFLLKLTFEFIKELGSASIYHHDSNSNGRLVCWAINVPLHQNLNLDKFMITTFFRCTHWCLNLIWVGLKVLICYAKIPQMSIGPTSLVRHQSLIKLSKGKMFAYVHFPWIEKHLLCCTLIPLLVSLMFNQW
jgi:hypothetical protein